IFAGLFANPAIQRVAGYATCLYSIFAAKLYNIFNRSLEIYEGHYPDSARPWYFSVFSAATFHLGSHPRRIVDDDSAWGWAAITALGNYNPDKGGHIILWDLNLVVRFPPGTTILIPRALIRYSFVSVAAHETRYSLVQYTPAPMLNFAANAGRT
ncbi:hypothetical protein B0H17DRAFT_836072, partial [Mycena rosella]